MAQRVLIVDDSNSMRQMIRFTLEEEGYQVEGAVNGLDGTKKLDAFKPELIITDIHMPEMNGIDFIIHTRQQGDHKFTPIIVLTTESEKEMQEKGKQAGATAWLVKPFSPEVLVETVKKVAG